MYFSDMEYEELIRCFDNPVRRKVLSALVDDGPMTPRMLLQTLHSTSHLLFCSEGRLLGYPTIIRDG